MEEELLSIIPGKQAQDWKTYFKIKNKVLY